ncbi:FAD/NAD(P)-binding domain-containing protein [Papiliotrema laurentii]|uniref:FAD/NAD(P)-binding domain-containing protein n=1 Tax=Papiliotrema laurentii TaxID=5418 RepID=A0AAD9FUW8_PAPLA|nr:FAD/NAD(P)-binding domain-containing protein [Papiliotrema laurentii]
MARDKTKKRVCVVGAGASGMSAAYSMSLDPEKFEVTVFDKEKEAGGMATSIKIDAEKYGAGYINDGVQGCSPQFYNTIRMFDILGFKPTPVGMQVSFGKDKYYWSNVYPSQLSRSFASDIKKFGRVLKIVKMFEVIFALIPVHLLLRIFRFTPDFGERMIYPLVALFFGTGNQTPFISSAILERVFLDPSMKLFEFDEKSLLASIPTMYGFPNLHDTYTAWKSKCEEGGNVTFNLGHEVVSVKERSKKGVVIEYKTPEGQVQEGRFDDLILAVDADSALKLLGKTATWRERKILGNVLYLHDVTITHNDLDYMKRHYETEYRPELNAESQGKADDEAFAFAEKNFRPLYYIKEYEEDRAKIEMSFDLTHYQPQFRGIPPTGPPDNDRLSSSSDSTAVQRDATNPGDPEYDSTGEAARKGKSHEGQKEAKLEDHVFQTIFLDKDGSRHLWTDKEILPEKRIYEKWWKQQSHRAQHYYKVVPWMMFLNGKNHTYFAGAWTILNMHELAVTSGFSAAYRLGAKYPFSGDQGCERLFKLYLAASHGMRARKEDRRGLFV